MAAAAAIPAAGSLSRPTATNPQRAGEQMENQASEILDMAAGARGDAPGVVPAKLQTFTRSIGMIDFEFRPIGKLALVEALGADLMRLVQRTMAKGENPAVALVDALTGGSAADKIALVYRVLSASMTAPALGPATDAENNVVTIDDLADAGLWEAVFMGALTGTLEAFAADALAGAPADGAVN